MLQSWRFQTGTASFPDDALHKVRRADARAPYELLLVDWKTFGLGFIHEVRRIAATRSAVTPSIVALALPHNRHQVSEALAGMPNATVLDKPVTPSRLFDTVVRLQHGMEEDKQECLAAGMNAHVSKPIDPGELVRTLLAWVPRQVQTDDDRRAVDER
jgi:two-component system, sensor histidine kinase and response regulator